MEKLNFVSFTSSKNEGQMNTTASFYPEGMTPRERKEIMEANKKKLGERVGFVYKRLFIPIQKNADKPDLYENGHTLTLDNGIVTSYDNLYNFNYNCDIVKITRETPYVAIGYPMADCAVITAVNLKTEEAVMAHCGGEYINRYLPMQLIDSLGGNEDDIRVHVSPFAHSLHYRPGTKPTWVSDRQIWDGFLDFNVNGLDINQLGALRKMLKQRMIDDKNIYFYPFDTIKDSNFYSNSNANNGIKEDEGRQIAGVVLTDERNYGHDPYVKVFR